MLIRLFAQNEVCVSSDLPHHIITPCDCSIGLFTFIKNLE